MPANIQAKGNAHSCIRPTSALARQTAIHASEFHLLLAGLNPLYGNLFTAPKVRLCVDDVLVKLLGHVSSGDHHPNRSSRREDCGARPRGRGEVQVNPLVPVQPSVDFGALVSAVVVQTPLNETLGEECEEGRVVL